MRIRNTIIAFCILIIAVAVAYFALKRERFEEPAKTTTGLMYPGFDRSAVNQITIKSPTSEAQLLRVDGEWKVSDQGQQYPADQKAIDSLFEKVEGFTTTEVVAEKPENRALFQVDEQGASVVITASDGTVIADFIIGKNGPDYLSTYVRQQNSDQVYLISQFIKSFFDKPANSWKDRTLLNVEKEQIAEFSVQTKDKPALRLKQTNNEWDIIEPETAKADIKAVERIVNGFRNFAASEFSPDSDPAVTGLESPALTLTVKKIDGTEQTVLFGNEKESKGVYAKAQGSEWIYIVPKYRMTNLDKPVAELKAKEEPPAASEGDAATMPQ